MKKNNVLSVIIPIYNAEIYLEECLNSVLNQSMKEIEIICVNDGSTDNSYDILKRYQEKYKNIVLINQENQGVNAARSIGLKNATGEYIAWVDADDYVEKNMYEKMYKLAKKSNLDIVICNYKFIPKEVVGKKKWFKEYNGVVDWKFISRNTIQWNKIVKKSLLDSLDICNLFETIGEGCYSFVLMSTNKIMTLNECLYNYRVGHTSLSSNYNNIEWYVKTVERAIKKYNYVLSKNYEEKWKEYFYYVYLYYNLILLIVASYNNNIEIFNKAKKVIMENKLFGKKYSEYLKNSFSNIKLIVLRLCIRSYWISKIISKIVLK